MNKKQLKKYAEMIVKTGINVQKGQDVIIRCNLDQPDFVAMVVEQCYKCKANSVTVDWGFDKLTKLEYKYRSVKSMSNFPEWKLEKEKHMVKTNPCLIWLDSDDPDGLKGINQAKMSEVRKNISKITKPYKDERENKYQWVIVGVPGPAWAKKVFPDLPKKKAMEALWEKILYTSRADGEDPVKAWNEHNARLKAKIALLNSLSIEYLQYNSSNGTDFRVHMIPDALWMAGSEHTQGSNIEFSPNIPTEECFISPDRNTAQGIVYSSKPLSYQGQLIEDFSIRFDKGRVVEVKARKGEDLLTEMVNMDDGAHYLGECALVPYDSPINNTGILFYNTLYDENAACHLALGIGFSNCIKDYEKYTQKEINEKGVNDSIIHVDFMIGNKDMNIVAHTRDGKDIQIFKDGNWAI